MGRSSFRLQKTISDNTFFVIDKQETDRFDCKRVDPKYLW